MEGGDCVRRWIMWGISATGSSMEVEMEESGGENGGYV